MSLPESIKASKEENKEATPESSGRQEFSRAFPFCPPRHLMS